MPSQKYNIEIEYNQTPGQHPISVYVERGRLNPKGHRVAEFHGKLIGSLLRKGMDAIVLEEIENGNVLGGKKHATL